jgi:serine/threonine-protein kinase
MSVEADPLVGTDLAGYRLESVLGRGGMGVVYLATDLRLKRRVALKLVAPELAADPRFQERFLREAELAASLDHSHIVPVYGAGETDGQLWMAMRYVQGTDLGTLLEQEAPLEPARALELVSQVGSALDAAHAHGLVHRDVKPANVLVTQEGREEHCYLADFGLARSPEATGFVGSAHLSGTIDYTAPEQSAHEPLDHRADVYSLGCVLYECLAGEPPFKRPRAAATLFAHASEPPPSLHELRPELPEAIDGIIATALAKDPRDRYATCGDLCRGAETALGLGSPGFSRRKLIVAGAGTALAIAAAAAVPAILLTRRGESAATPTPPAVLSADGVLRIDPATGARTAATPTEIRADTLAIGDGVVWVLDTGTGELVAIDPASNRVSRRITPEMPTRATTVAAGEGTVWLQDPYVEPSLWRVDLDTGSYLPHPDKEFDGLTIGFGSVWAVSATGGGSAVVSRGFLNRLDPATGESELHIEGEWWDYDDLIMVTGLGLVWSVARAANVLVPGHPVSGFDPQVGAVAVDFTIEFAIGDFAVGEDALWVTALDTDTVAELDPTTGGVLREVRVGRVPERIAVGGGAIWATSARDGTITRVDQATLDVQTIEVGGVPTDVAAGESGVWATVDVS